MNTENITRNTVNPMVLLRTAEFQHRRGGGQRPECIKMGPDFYHSFMEAMRSAKEMLRRDSEEAADQIDTERPHLLGIPIVCESGLRGDIEFYVPARAKESQLQSSIIILP